MQRVRSWVAALAVTSALVVGGACAAGTLSGRDTGALSRVADDRDAAQAAALEAALMFNTVDSRHAARTVDRWLGVSGGALHRKVEAARSTIVSRTERLGTDSSAEVLDAGISAFDSEAGTATVVAVLSVRTTPPRGKVTTRTQRVEALVQRVEGTWQLTFLSGVGTDR